MRYWCGPLKLRRAESKTRWVVSAQTLLLQAYTNCCLTFVSRVTITDTVTLHKDWGLERRYLTHRDLERLRVSKSAKLALVISPAAIWVNVREDPGIQVKTSAIKAHKVCDSISAVASSSGGGREGNA